MDRHFLGLFIVNFVMFCVVALKGFVTLERKKQARYSLQMTDAIKSIQLAY